MTAAISFGLRADDRRRVELRQSGHVLWSGSLEPGVLQKVALPSVILAPGDTGWNFTTDRPAATPNPDDRRPIAFSVRDLKIEVR